MSPTDAWFIANLVLDEHPELIERWAAKKIRTPASGFPRASR